MTLLLWLTFMFVLCPAVVLTGVLMYTGKWTLPSSNMRQIRDAQTRLALAKLREKEVIQGTKIDAAEHARIEHALALPPPEEIARAQREKRSEELVIAEADTEGEDPVCKCGHRRSGHKNWDGKVSGCNNKKQIFGDLNMKYEPCPCVEYVEADDQPIEFDAEVDVGPVDAEFEEVMDA